MRLKDWLKDNAGLFGDTDLRFLIKTLFSCRQLFEPAGDACLNTREISSLDKIKNLYIKGVPLAYILGKEEFFAREFKVDKRVLIPRKETELVVERALDIIKENNLRYILDLCCGCGNIAITIKKSGPEGIVVFSSDISLEALEVSKINDCNHKSGVKLVNADLLSAFKGGSFDMIISNPPYVERENIKGSLKYEPVLSLSGGKDGLRFIDKILDEACFYLKSGGYLVMEIGYKHRQRLEKFVGGTSFYEAADWIKDYSGYFRGVVLRKRK